MKIYIASKIEEFERVLALQVTLRQKGHIITCDWARHWAEHKENWKAEGESEKPIGIDRQFIAIAEASGVERCELLIIYPEPHGASAYAEMVAALISGKKVIAINFGGFDPALRTFYHHPDIIWCKDEHAALTRIGIAVL